MSNLNQLHVLVVEDDLHTRNMLRHMLQMIGVKFIFEAENGAEGLNKLENGDKRIDVVLSDWSMPCMTGIELLLQIRKTRATLPFMLITGKQDLASVTAAKEAGVNLYLHKPISPVQLQQKLSHLLMH